MRDGRLQQRGQAPVSHLHQAGHPGLVLLLAGRRRLSGGGAAAAGPPPLPSPPALAAGRDLLLLFPRPARGLRFLPASAALAPALAPSSPGPFGTRRRGAHRGRGAVCPGHVGWKRKRTCPGWTRCPGAPRLGTVPAAQVSAGAGTARCAGYAGQVGTPGEGGGLSPASSLSQLRAGLCGGSPGSVVTLVTAGLGVGRDPLGFEEWVARGR